MPQQHLAEALQFSGVPVTIELPNSSWCHSEAYIRASIFGLRAALDETQVRAWGAEVKRRNAILQENAVEMRAKALLIEKRVKDAKAVYRKYLAQMAQQEAA